MNKDKKTRFDHKLDKELDRELEGIFPASDPLKVTRPKKKTSRGKKAELCAAEKGNRR